MNPFLTDYNELFSILKQEIASYFNSSDVTNAIIGLSGGIDSAVVASLISYAKKDKLLSPNFKLIGCSLPTASNDTSEVDRARLAGEAYCDTFVETDIESIVAEFKHTIDSAVGRIMLQDKWDRSKDRKIRIGNIKARARMVFLYDMAKMYNGLVMSTDNFTEYMLGFWTLHGDVGDFGPIQNLWKTEVYKLARHIGDECLLDCVNAIPTDGLGITNSDLDQLLPDWEFGHEDGYEVIDRILSDHINTGSKYTTEELASRPVIRRHLLTEFKRNNPYNISRALITQSKLKYVPF